MLSYENVMRLNLLLMTFALSSGDPRRNGEHSRSERPFLQGIEGRPSERGDDGPDRRISPIQAFPTRPVSSHDERADQIVELTQSLGGRGDGGQRRSGTERRQMVGEHPYQPSNELAGR